MLPENNRLCITQCAMCKLDTIGIQSVLLYGGTFIWIYSKILNEVSDFSHLDFLFKLLLCAAFGMVALAELIRNGRYGLSDITCWLLVVFLGVSSYVAEGSIVLQGVTLAYFLRNCDIRAIFRVSLVAVSSALLLVLVLLAFDLIGNGTDGSTDSRMRWTLGFGWPSRAPNLFLTICLSLLVLYGDRLNVFVIVALFAVAVVLYAFTNSRAPFLFTVLALVFAVYVKLRKPREPSRFICNFATVSFMLCAIVIILLSLFYNPGSDFMRFLNGALSNRLNYSHMAFDNVGVSLFGSNVFHDDTIQDNFVGYLDSGYLVLLFSFGLLAFAIIMTLLTRMAYLSRASSNYCFMIALLLVAAHGMIEWTLIYVQYTPFLLLIFHRRGMFKDFDCEHESFARYSSDTSGQPIEARHLR